MPSGMFLNKGGSIFLLLAFNCPMPSAPCPQNSHAGSALFSIIQSIPDLVFSGCGMMRFLFG